MTHEHDTQTEWERLQREYDAYVIDTRPPVYREPGVYLSGGDFVKAMTGIVIVAACIWITAAWLAGWWR